MNTKETKKSRDEVINKQGKEMMKWLDETGLGVLNGCNREDREGVYTYIDTRGETVIDFVAKERKEIGMKIKETGESNHMKVEAFWERSIREEIETIQEEDKEYAVRKEEEVEKFKENLQRLREEDTWTKIKEKIKKTIRKRRTQRKIRENEWWDEECNRKRRELMRIIKNAKEGKGETGQRRVIRKEYKVLLEKKKEQKINKWLKEIEEDKSMKRFWEEVNGKK